MFGSTNPFGQSSSSPFGTPVFGQTNNSASNPFAPKPFGSTSPFGTPTGSSVFGGMSTGVFGTAQPSTPAFGASSSPAFGSSTPAFGASSAPSFGSSLFGQKPAFGGFGSSPSQSSPFGSAFQQTQPAFGNNPFGSSIPFGGSSQPAFGAASTPAFGAASTPAFGATSTPAFGVSGTPAFGSTSTPTFGSAGTAFGVSSTPAFGASSTPAFGASSTSVFGSSSTPAFGASNTLAFGASSTPGFGASSTPSFSFGSTPAFGQTSSTFGSTPFGSTAFGAQSSPFGAQSTTPTFGSPGFGQSAFRGQNGGSRVAPYTPTTDVDGGASGQPPGKLESICAMPVYKDKSHEELRWEDYQRGDKGGPNPSNQSGTGINFGSAQTSANPFSSNTSSNPFAPKTSTFGSTGFGASSTPAFSSPFGPSSSSPFGTTASASSPSLFGASSTSAFGASSTPSLFGASSTPAFGSSPSIFGSSSATGTTSAFGSSLTFGNTQSSGLFQSSTPSLGQSTSAFGQATPAFGQTTSTFGQTASAFGQTNPFSTPSTGFGGSLFQSSTPSLLSNTNPVGFGQTTPSLSSPFQTATPAQTSGLFSFSNFGQTQPAASSGFGGVSNAFGQGFLGQPIVNQNTMAMQSTAVTNPFGTLPAMPQMSIGRAGSASSVQYGISSIPVADKAAPVRISSLLTSRHLSQRRTRVPARKYHPKSDGPKVPFFSDDEEVLSTPKADALFIPRENPRALVVRPLEQWPQRTSAEKRSPFKDTSSPVHGNGKMHEGSAPVLNGFTTDGRDENVVENSFGNHSTSPVKSAQKANGIHEDQAQKGDSYITISGHRAGEAAIVYEHGADIEALMPKLRNSDYYTEPRIQELASKERAEPGYCRHVKDFVVGRHGYGSIKFTGETDVRRLDLESIVQFNNKEVVVYMDESKTPPVGQGLNKPAEVTLLNIRCFNKKTGEPYTEGPNIGKYRERLRKQTADQGAEFVSYDPVKGEWKFRVDHFSKYGLAVEVDSLVLSLEEAGL